MDEGVQVKYYHSTNDKANVKSKIFHVLSIKHDAKMKKNTQKEMLMKILFRNQKQLFTTTIGWGE